LKLRYKLMPYYYSLAHRAYREGLPVISPMPLEFPTDLAVRKMGNQKMIGSSLMAAISARYGESSRNVYLPAGEWIDLHTGERYKSGGEYVYNIKVNDGGIFRLPLFARQGAIVPMMKELSERSNIAGKMFDGSYNHDLLITVFPSINKSSFTLIEDDGQTVDYKKKRLSETLITQVETAKNIEINLAATSGDYDYMPGSREYQLAVYVSNDVKAVKLNGKEIEFKLQNGVLKTNLGVHSQRSEKNVVIELK
jgi:alpha-glucosidase (family GH31 glycosyl hydrolase)